MDSEYDDPKGVTGPLYDSEEDAAAAAGPSEAVGTSCTWDGQEWSIGTLKCRNKVQFKCTNKGWVKTGSSCTDG